MKKAAALALAGLCLLSSFLFFSPDVQGQWRSPDVCHHNWGRCRTRAMGADIGVIRTAILLTVCDYALGRCLIYG